MELNQKILDLMIKNRRTFNEFQYTVPSPSSYPYQWFWDSCFHAIILSYFNMEDAKKEILSVVSKQFENGLIPHMIYWERGELINIDWGKQDTSTITQPPVIGHAVWHIFSKDQDKRFLESLYLSLKKFTNYLLSQRDPRGHNLIGIINPDESGEDDSPRFDIPLELDPKHTKEVNFNRRLHLVKQNLVCNFDAPFCMKNFFWVKDVPFNVIMIDHLSYMTKIALEIGMHEDANHFLYHADLIKDAMRKLMFEDGVFYSTYGQDYKKIKVLSWAILAPLFANLYTKQEAETLIEKHFLNEDEFNLKYVVPTVAKSEASFDPKGFWRGPVWMAINWFVYKGLANYGLVELAEKVKQSSIQLLEHSGFRENYNPLTGEGGGAEEFTWGGLIIDMN